MLFIPLFDDIMFRKGKEKMMNRKSIFNSFLLIVFFLFAFGCGKAEKGSVTEWKGKIDWEDDVKVIRNPAEPVYGEIPFDLEEDLSIGREDDENYLFYRAVDVAVDEQDNIYVLEYRNCRIQKFDRDGNYLQTIGRKGQGPGELERPIQLLLDKTGKIYVKDGRKVKIFDREGNYLRDFLLKNYPFELFTDGEGNIWGKFSVRTESGQAMSFDHVNSQGETVKTIASYPYGATFKRSGDVTWGVSHQYLFDLQVAKIDDNTFCYGYSKDYELNIIDEKGDLLFRIRKEEPDYPITEKEKDKIRGQFKRAPEQVRKAILFPDHRPFFGPILTDDKGRIYVLRIRSPLDEEKIIRYDIFSREGYYLYRTSLSDWPQLIKGGYLYTLITSEETGEEQIKRFRIKNWDKIKEGI